MKKILVLSYFFLCPFFVDSGFGDYVEYENWSGGIPDHFCFV